MEIFPPSLDSFKVTLFGSFAALVNVVFKIGSVSKYLIIKRCLSSVWFIFKDGH